GVEEVGPRVGQPVVTRALEVVGLPLLVAGLRPEVLDVSVAGVGKERLAERTLGVLRGTKCRLDLSGGVNGLFERERLRAADVVVGCRLVVVAMPFCGNRALLNQNGRGRGPGDANHLADRCDFINRSRVFRISSICWISWAVSP